jgi:hypothetical protein
VPDLAVTEVMSDLHRRDLRACSFRQVSTIPVAGEGSALRDRRHAVLEDITS